MTILFEETATLENLVRIDSTRTERQEVTRAAQLIETLRPRLGLRPFTLATLVASTIRIEFWHGDEGT